MSLPSPTQHQFSQVPPPQIQRSILDRKSAYKTTFNSGYLVPFFLEEILPGDTMNLRATLLGRLSTLIFPLMDNIFLDTFFFFVPNRLVWTNWEKFNGAQDDPGDSTDFTIPTILDEAVGPEFAEGSLADYFGLPTQVVMQNPAGTAEPINALPFRGYSLIWRDWFRDENLQDSPVVDKDNGPDEVDDYPLRKRGKRKDYFTGCLPWPQKGDSVELPLGTTAPVIGDGKTMGMLGAVELQMRATDNSGFNYTVGVQTGEPNALVGATPGGATNSGDTMIGLTTDPTKSHVFADLSTATAATINQLRQAFAFQSILELDARGGTRYVEILKAHFGVTSPDFRLQRPEYLGGNSTHMSISTVSQTSSTDATSPQANLSAFGQVSSQSGFSKSFVEHGYVFGLVNVRSDITYQQGLHKMWSRRTRFDFYLPSLAHLGEQAVLNKEIMYKYNDTDTNGVFGYQERWAEYRYKPSMVTGKFRSNATGTLDAWHLATEFADIPLLNDAFIQDAPPIDRVVAISDEPQIIMDSFIQLSHARPMPVYSIPAQLGRF